MSRKSTLWLAFAVFLGCAAPCRSQTTPASKDDALDGLLKTLEGDKETAENREESEEIEASPIEADFDSADPSMFTFPTAEHEFKPPDRDGSESEKKVSPIEANFETMGPKVKAFMTMRQAEYQPFSSASPDIWGEFDAEIAREEAIMAEARKGQSGSGFNRNPR